MANMLCRYTAEPVKRIPIYSATPSAAWLVGGLREALPRPSRFLAVTVGYGSLARQGTLSGLAGLDTKLIAIVRQIAGAARAVSVANASNPRTQRSFKGNASSAEWIYLKAYKGIAFENAWQGCRRRLLELVKDRGAQERHERIICSASAALVRRPVVFASDTARCRPRSKQEGREYLGALKISVRIDARAPFGRWPGRHPRDCQRHPPSWGRRAHST